MGVIFGFEAREGFEPYNTTVRWTVVRHRLDGDDTIMKQIPLTPSSRKRKKKRKLNKQMYQFTNGLQIITMGVIMSLRNLNL